MPADDVVLRAARNAFLFSLLALLGVSTYQFVTVGGLDLEIAVIWIVAVAGYYGSTWYYGRRSGPSEAETEKD